MRAVIILGAGASAPFGVPTLRKMFQDRCATRYLEEHPDFLRVLQEVFWLPRGRDLTTSHLGLTIEEIMTLIRDYQARPFDVPDLGIPDVDAFRKHLYMLIKKAVYDDKSSDGRHLNLLIQLARERFTHVTWASFNWDCIFEASYYYSGGPTSAYRCNPSLAVKLKGWRETDSSLDFCILKTEYSKQPLRDVFGVACLSGGSNRLTALDCCCSAAAPADTPVTSSLADSPHERSHHLRQGLALGQTGADEQA